MIEVQDIKKSFDGVEILKGISATFTKEDKPYHRAEWLRKDRFPKDSLGLTHS